MNQTIPLRVFAMMLACAILGCATPIPYKNVNFADGVYDAEILSIATHEVEISPEKNNFSLKGSFVDNRFTRCMENHRLVVFPGRKQAAYYVVVDKRSGVVSRSGTMSRQKDPWVAMVRGIDGCYE